VQVISLSSDDGTAMLIASFHGGSGEARQP
jgi:hypothetical protein